MQQYNRYFIILFLSSVLLGCNKDDDNTTDQFITYKVKIENNSSSELTDISLGMVGVEGTISINRLAAGSSTDYYEFLLPDISSWDAKPISWGDYNGDYTQGGIEKSISIVTPDKIITIKIEELYADLIALAQEKGTIRVLVDLAGDWSNPDKFSEEYKQSISNAQDNLIESLGDHNYSVLSRFKYVHGLAIEVDLDSLYFLIESPLVSYISLDEECEPH